MLVASSHFRTQVGLPEKVLLAVLLKSTRPSYDMRFCSCPCPPEARQTKIDARGFASCQPAAKFGAPSAFFCGEASHSRV